MALLKYNEFINESSPNPKFPHELKNENHWRNVAYNNKYLTDVLDTIFKRQRGFASDRQMAVLRRKEMGITTPYHTKN
jgi:hypothetical protein